MAKLTKAVMMYNNMKHFALSIKIIITNYFHFDKKQSLEFDIQANKLFSINAHDYYDLDHAHTRTCIGTLIHLENIEASFNNPNTLEIWNLLKIYSDAERLLESNDINQSKRLYLNLKQSIENAEKHFLLNESQYGKIDANENFYLLLLQLKNIIK